MLRVYDVIGREVETLVDDYESGGPHIVEFNWHNHASGMYFYRITAPVIYQAKRMLLVK